MGWLGRFNRCCARSRELQQGQLRLGQALALILQGGCHAHNADTWRERDLVHQGLGGVDAVAALDDHAAVAVACGRIAGLPRRG